MKHLVKKLSTLFIVAVLAVTMLLPATANAQERTIKYKQNLVLSKENTFAIVWGSCFLFLLFLYFNN